MSKTFYSFEKELSGLQSKKDFPGDSRKAIEVE